MTLHGYVNYMLYNAYVMDMGMATGIRERIVTEIRPKEMRHEIPFKLTMRLLNRIWSWFLAVTF